MKIGLKEYFSNKIHYLDLCPLWRCNAKCPTCGAWKRNVPDMTWNQALQINKHFNHLSRLVIEGGEPTLWPHWVDFVNLFHKTHPKTEIIIITNAISTEKIIADTKELVKDKKVRFLVSVNGIGTIHDESRGVKGAYEKTIKTVEYLRMFWDVRLSFVPFERNWNQFASVCNLGPTNLCYPVKAAKFGENMKWKTVEGNDLDQVIQAKQKQQRYLDKWAYTVFVNKVKNKELMPCWAGKKMLHISPEGIIRPCHLVESRTVGYVYGHDIEIQLRDFKIPQSCQYSPELCNDCFIFWTIRHSVGYILKERIKLWLK